MDGGAWKATVHGVAKSRTRLSDFTHFPGGSVVKNPPVNAGHAGSIPGWGRFPGEGKSNQLQYSCTENSVDGGDWWATVHAVTKSWTRLND